MFIIYLTLRAGELNQIEGGYSNSSILDKETMAVTVFRYLTIFPVVLV